MKLYAITSGMDWSDASCDHLLLPDNMSIDNEKVAWNEWYNNTYVVELHADKHPKYVSFIQWLINRGAKEPVESVIIDWSDI